MAALADYAKARATLDRVTGEILERYGISIVEAYRGRVSSTTSTRCSAIPVASVMVRRGVVQPILLCGEAS